MKKEDSKKKNAKEKKDNKIDNKTKNIIIAVSICIIAVIVIFVINIISTNMEYSKYEKYEEKMNAYGFNRLYDNSSSKTSEKVTKSEAVKMAIGVCLNTYDISGIAKTPTEDYQNAIWVLYSQDIGIASANEVNKNTSKDKVKYADVIKYFANAKMKLLNVNLINEPKKQISDIERYSGFEQEAILDMLSNDILQEVSSKLKGNKKIFKGKLNEIVVNYVEKYNILGENIQTDPSKMPSNASEYAYISKDVEKEVYEMEFIIDTQEQFKSPRQCYLDKKQSYVQMKDKIERYYNTLLNVDYQKTTKESLKNNLNNLTLSGTNDNILNDYIEYIKQNNIKLVGNAKVQDPIIYFDGINYRIRTKLDFKVESSNTTDNLLYIDFETGKSTRYDKKDYSIYVDVSFGSALKTGTYYLKNLSLQSLSKDENLGITDII